MLTSKRYTSHLELTLVPSAPKPKVSIAQGVNRPT